MTRLMDKLAAQFAVHLRPEETVLAAAVVEYKAVAKSVGGALGGALVVSAGVLSGAAGGTLLGSQARARRGTARYVPTAGRTIWALTDRRMIFFRYKAGRRVGDLQRSIPLGKVANVRAEKARVSLGRLDLEFVDGSGIRLDLYTNNEADAINRAYAAVPAPPKSVTLDRWCGERELPSIRRALEAGDTAPLVAEYTRADHLRREFLVECLIDGLPPLAVLDAWPEASPESGLAYLARGVQRVSMAWDARGNGYADTVSAPGWQVFFDRLNEAEDDLRRSTQLDDDGVAWSLMITSGKGLQVGVEELAFRYERATNAGPGFQGAASRLLQGLCAKWGGSNELMFTFARMVGAEAADGDPLHFLITSAHFERALEFREDDEGRKRYRSDPYVQAELVAAAMRSVFSPAFGTTLQHRCTLNWFAMVLGYFNRFDVARPLLEQIGGSPTVPGWDRFNDGAKVFNAWRQKAQLPPVHG